nr:MAG TPA: hypothetical protein [Caudoviricetes sp.]
MPPCCKLGIKRKFATPIIYQLLYQVSCQKSRKRRRNKRFKACSNY